GGSEQEIPSLSIFGERQAFFIEGGGLGKIFPPGLEGSRLHHPFRPFRMPRDLQGVVGEESDLFGIETRGGHGLRFQQVQPSRMNGHPFFGRQGLMEKFRKRGGGGLVGFRLFGSRLKKTYLRQLTEGGADVGEG